MSDREDEQLLLAIVGAHHPDGIEEKELERCFDWCTTTELIMRLIREGKVKMYFPEGASDPLFKTVDNGKS